MTKWAGCCDCERQSGIIDPDQPAYVNLMAVALYQLEPDIVRARFVYFGTTCCIITPGYPLPQPTMEALQTSFGGCVIEFSAEIAPET